jgi:hypothetical protein
MGKRGPAPKGKYEGKSKVLSTRIRPDTRKWLEEAAKKSGRSLSQEIEHRLRWSFDQDELTVQTFGSRRNYAFMRSIALLMEAIWDPDKSDATHWLDDPQAFWQVREATNRLFDMMQPQPPFQPTNPYEMFGGGRRAARELMEDIKAADPAADLDRTSERDRLLARLQEDLGEAAARANVDRSSLETLKRALALALRQEPERDDDNIGEGESE